MRTNKAGFTLIELMIVVAIITFLSVLAVPSLMKSLAKAKRAEAYVNLSSLAMAEKAYFAEHGSYTTNIADDLGWKPGGNFNYTYGFPGTTNKNNFVGALKTAATELKQSQLSADGFTITAAGDIDADGVADIIAIDDNNVVTILQDDLKK
jgi:prepilin-type N-terminal cleavage/methylation domain-containing protein